MKITKKIVSKKKWNFNAIIKQRPLLGTPMEIIKKLMS